MINGLEIRSEINPKGKKIFDFMYSEYFDRDTGETDNFSDKIESENCLDGLREFREKGRSSIIGQYGSLSLEGNPKRKNFVALTMKAENYAISISTTLDELYEAFNLK